MPRMIVIAAVFVISGGVFPSKAQLDAGATCEPEVVTTGNEASITCRFGIDLLQTKRSFFVDKYDRPGLPGVASDMVMECHWDEGNLKCLTDEGYTFDDVVKNGVTLKIPTAKTSHSGYYVCRVGLRDYIQTCSLTVEDPPEQVPTPATDRPNQSQECKPMHGQSDCSDPPEQVPTPATDRPNQSQECKPMHGQSDCSAICHHEGSNWEAILLAIILIICGIHMALTVIFKFYMRQ